MPALLDRDVKYLKGVGPKRSELFGKLGIKSVRDLIYHLPRDYTDFSNTVSIAEAVWDEYNAIEAEVVYRERPAMIRRGMTIFKVLVTDGADDMTVIIYNSKFLYESLEIGKSYVFFGKVAGTLTRKEMSSPRILSSSAGDKLQPIYPLTAGLSQNVLRVCLKNALSEITPEETEILPEDVLKECKLMPETAALKAVHFPKTREEAAPARRRLAFDELLVLRLGMI